MWLKNFCSICNVTPKFLICSIRYLNFGLIFNVIQQIKHLSKIGFFLREQLGKDVILNFLSKSYLPFFNHYRMTKSIVNYHGLLRLLQTFEKDHLLHKEMVNVVGGSSSGGHHLFKKEKKKKMKNKKMQSAGSQAHKSKSKSDQSQTECFYSKKQDHWKKNCLQYIAFFNPNRLKNKKQSACKLSCFIVYDFHFLFSSIGVLHQ